MPATPTPYPADERGKPLTDEQLLDVLQRQTFRYFWEGAHPASGLALDRCHRRADPPDTPVSIAGTGFGVMALLVACERAWVSREQALARLALMLDCLEKATCYHGMYPHFLRGDTGATVPFSRKDDGADLVESSLLFQGLLCARAYFDRALPAEQRVRERIDWLWREAEWDWYARDGRDVLTWHWSPNNGFALGHEIRGWNECLMTYLLAASAPRY
ncbi:MAG: beta-glucosidase, partial [Gammaproteobacteria bacterium]|nr:beta-glucosidase [Gammaproteobacteria bacterium]